MPTFCWKWKWPWWRHQAIFFFFLTKSPSRTTEDITQLFSRCSAPCYEMNCIILVGCPLKNVEILSYWLYLGWSQLVRSWLLRNVFHLKLKRKKRKSTTPNSAGISQQQRASKTFYADFLGGWEAGGRKEMDAVRFHSDANLGLHWLSCPSCCQETSVYVWSTARPSVCERNL